MKRNTPTPELLNKWSVLLNPFVNLAFLKISLAIMDDQSYLVTIHVEAVTVIIRIFNKRTYPFQTLVVLLAMSVVSFIQLHFDLREQSAFFRPAFRIRLIPEPQKRAHSP